jgi:D-3-phosphoglycerate dehydrogenase
MARIFLTHTPASRDNYYGAEALHQLRLLGEVVLHESGTPLAPDELIAAAGDADVIVADRLTAGPREIFESLPRLRAFVRVAVDIRNIDVPAATHAGVLVTQAGPGFIESVVELILGMMVDLSRGMSDAVLAYRQGMAPDIRMGRQLSGSVLGVIGYGGIGRRLAELGQALGMRVLVSDPFATVADDRILAVAMPDLLVGSDVVVCLAVANDATENLMNAEAFAQMRKGALFINASRGNLVDEAALAAALRAEHLGGAGLDVGREVDQMPSPELALLPNVIATPHIGGLTPPAIEAQALETTRQVRDILLGLAPAGSVNPAEWSRRP